MRWRYPVFGAGLLLCYLVFAAAQAKIVISLPEMVIPKGVVLVGKTMLPVAIAKSKDEQPVLLDVVGTYIPTDRSIIPFQLENCQVSALAMLDAFDRSQIRLTRLTCGEFQQELEGYAINERHHRGITPQCDNERCGSATISKDSQVLVVVTRQVSIKYRGR